MDKETILILKMILTIILGAGAVFSFKYLMLNFKSYLKPKAAPMQERLKLNKQFSAMMKDKKLKRNEILAIKNYIYSITREQYKGYNNECHYICHCIKHCDLSLKNLYEIYMMLGGK